MAGGGRAMIRARWSTPGGVAIATTLLVTPLAAADAPGRATPPSARKACGPNSLYVLLRLVGLEIRPGDTDKYYPTHPSGMSMLDLKRACGDFGVASRVVRCGTEHLYGMTYPVIARVKFGLEDEADHFVVITRRVGEGQIEIIDGTTGALNTILIERLKNVWDGHLLIPEGRREAPGSLGWMAAWAAAIASLLVACRRKLPRWAGAGVPRGMAARPLALLVSAALATSLAGTARGDGRPTADDDREGPGLWRTPANDGLNCLFLQLRAIGYQASYREFHRAFGAVEDRDRLSVLAATSRRLSHELVPARLNLSDLEALRRPTLVHLEQEGAKRGYYALFINSEAQTVFVFHGGKATIEGMPRDQFRREWTGIGLVPVGGDGGSSIGGLGLVAVALILAFAAWRGAPWARWPGLRARSPALPLFAWLIPAVLTCPGADAQGPTLDATVADALRENASRLSPLTVSYSWAYKTTLRRQEALRRINLGNRDPEQFFHEVAYDVSWQDGKYYRRRILPTSGDGRIAVEPHEDSTDGEHLYTGTKGAVQPIFFKRFLRKVAGDEPTAEYLKDPYFPTAGYHLPEISEWGNSHAEADPLYRLRVGGRLESVSGELVRGKNLIIIKVIGNDPDAKANQSVDLNKEREVLKYSRESPERQAELLRRLEERAAASGQRRFTYQVDPSLGHAIVGWEISTLSSDLIRRASCDQFEKVGGRSLWLPSHCRLEIFQFYLNPNTFFKEPFLSEEITVSSVNPAGLPPGKFVLAYDAPGTIVNDATLSSSSKKNRNGYVSYTIPAQARHLEEVIRRAKRGDPMVTYLSPPLKEASGQWFLTWPFILSNALAVIVAGAVVLVVRKRRHP